jgi:hypothetical protein
MKLFSSSVAYLPVIKKYLTFIEGFFIKHIPNMANLGINSEDENEVHKIHKCFG